MNNTLKTKCPFSDTFTVRKWTLVLFPVPIYYITPPASTETYCDCGNFSHPMNSVSKASVPSYFFAQTYTICGLKKLKTLNLQVFITLQNLRNHFSTISAKINWHTTSCKYRNCSGLTSVIIGNGVENISQKAFANCAELTDVYCYAEKVPSTYSDAFYWSSTGNATLHVPAASIEQYKATKPWSNFGTIVPLTDEDAIAEVQAVPVLIQTQGNTITVQGAEAGTEIILYGVNGVQLDSVIATTGVASLNASGLSGSVAIVKIGNKTVKVLMKQWHI